QRECMFEPIPCPLSSTHDLLPRAAQEIHLTICPRRPVPCPQCNISLPHNEVDQHIESVCPETFVPCPHSCFQRAWRERVAEWFNCDSCILNRNSSTYLGMSKPTPHAN